MIEEYVPETSGEDEFLRRALLMANSPEVMGLHDEEAAFSPRFERRMNRLLADPFRRARRELRPGWAKALNAAAMAALVLTVALFTTMLNPTARAWFENIVTQWQTYGVEFIFRGSDESGGGAWTAGYLPEGYQWDGEEDLLGQHSIFFTSPNGPTITLDYTPIEQGAVFSIDREHSDYEQITVNGRPAELFRSNTPGFPSYLFWTDQAENTAFRLMGEISPNELVKIAEGIAQMK